MTVDYFFSEVPFCGPGPPIHCGSHLYQQEGKKKEGRTSVLGGSQTSNKELRMLKMRHLHGRNDGKNSRKSLLGRKNEEPTHVLKGFVFLSSSMALTTDEITDVKC